MIQIYSFQPAVTDFVSKCAKKSIAILKFPQLEIMDELQGPLPDGSQIMQTCKSNYPERYNKSIYDIHRGIKDAKRELQTKLITKQLHRYLVIVARLACCSGLYIINMTDNKQLKIHCCMELFMLMGRMYMVSSRYAILSPSKGVTLKYCCCYGSSQFPLSIL